MTEPLLKHPKLQALLALWNERVADGPSSVPVPDQIDPMDMRPWIGNLVIMDVIEGDNFIYAYYGTQFASAFGKDMLGKSVDLLPDEQRTLIQKEYETVRRNRLPLTRTYTASFEGKLETWERLVLPLSADGETVDKLMVAAYRL
jgi:hypothetical protein